MRIWICIPVFNRVDFTLRCLSSLNMQTFQNFTLIICDHGSTDGTTLKITTEYPNAVVINADDSLWWTGAINLCVKYVLEHAGRDDYLLTLNNDNELPEDYLEELSIYSRKYPHAILASAKYDIVTGKLVAEGHWQSWITAKANVVTFEKDHLPGDENVIAVNHTSGRGAMFPIEVFRKLGLYDEVHLPHYGADYDFSHKAMRAGFPIYVCKTCRVMAHVDATGMTAVRNRFSLKGFIDYLTSTKSPANIKVHWWYGWNNCPKILFPTYIVLDIGRVIGSYFKYFLRQKASNI
ncbi:glycosyltransferase family 2 protein [Methylomonas sp. OY6]|uniref:Glycosyltransferase family 2 protein n=1 Tax=Methylomonas defluvii TaxID=3045149 RepID=A0ABU4UE78_9GAMM|nr:glycosyltransferase family 2 protein [Methylomonas sp. OY6]MDX8127150.1 glycosyltransferase family 2 protein [Methylomonas sp. OY6]